MGKIIGMDEIAPKKEPLIYIAGPNRGSNHGWREDVAHYFSRRTKANVAYPKFGDVTLHVKFKKPIAWGFYHLRHAMDNGVVMFWFPSQSARSNSNRTHLYDHPYGINSERTLGLCLGSRAYNENIKLLVSCHPEYGRVRSLEDLLKDWAPDIELLVGGLEGMCEETLRLLKK